MKVYIAGPIKGMENGNREAFAKRAEELELAGHVPVNPWNIYPNHLGPCIGSVVEHSTEHLYGCFLRADIEILMYCEAISLLPDWERSIGACTEHTIARSLGLKVLD